MQQLNRQDAMFLYSETPRLLMHLGSLHVYDPTTAPAPVTFETILEHVGSRLPLARVLRRRIVRVPLDVDYPYWVEDRDFDLEFHVRHIALPAPGTWQQLWTQATRLHSYPLDLRRPPWELYVIDGVNGVDCAPEGGFATYIKVHHSAIDGISGVELMNALHDLTPDGRAEVEDTWRGEEAPSSVALLARAAVNVTLAPARFVQLAGRTLPALRAPEARRSPVKVPLHLPTTRLNRKVTTHRTADGFVFELALAKRIREAVPGATVNDAVLAVVGGGLRAYLQAKGDLPDEPLHAGVPVSLRTEEEMGEAGNRISIMVVPLATDVADPVERLAAIRTATSESKEVSTAVGARAMAQGAELLPGALLGQAVRALPNVRARGTASLIGNVCVTNVPGSQLPLYLCGARMEAYYGMGPVYDYAGPIHLVTSYMGNLYVGVTSSHEIVPDIGFYVACMEQALAELVAATGADAPADADPPTPGPRPPRPPRARKAPARRKQVAP